VVRCSIPPEDSDFPGKNEYRLNTLQLTSVQIAVRDMGKSEITAKADVFQYINRREEHLQLYPGEKHLPRVVVELLRNVLSFLTHAGIFHWKATTSC
jgi:hypothetical protein